MTRQQRRKYDRIRRQAVSEDGKSFSLTAPNGFTVSLHTNISDEKWEALMRSFSKAGREYYKKVQEDRKKRLAEKVGK